LILALTDGEASDKAAFNAILDEIQDGLHGDVQVCLMGLSLEPEDIEWFEDEECDDTRIRTIEAWEVEQQMILYRKVIARGSEYNFEMHTYRALVTNFFPADYDYEAPLQTLRHRLYITLHALDRRFTGKRDTNYSGPDLGVLCLVSPGAGAFGICSYTGHPSCLCLGGIAACALGYLVQFWNKRQLGAGPTRAAVSLEEEGLSESDDQVIGRLVGQLQQRALEGRESQFVGFGWGTYFGGNFRRPRINRSQLALMQKAIGKLSPSETKMRDLQFQNVKYNAKALSAAVRFLRQAAEADFRE